MRTNKIIQVADLAPGHVGRMKVYDQDGVAPTILASAFKGCIPWVYTEFEDLEDDDIPHPLNATH